MNKVWIVLRNGVIDEVFDNKYAAAQHQKNLIKLWSITTLIEKEVKSL